MCDSHRNEVNSRLAASCQSACSACCKKGKIFLPDGQHDAILKWLEANAPEEMAEFESRCERFNAFYLYDQRSACQFLDGSDLCRLHTEGVKPRECFWWPLHVYTGGSTPFEIRVSTACCGGHAHLNPHSPYVDTVEAEARQLGGEILTSFRKVYPGSYSGIPLRGFHA